MLNDTKGKGTEGDKMCLTPKTIKKNGFYIAVGCGKCFECLQQRATMWAYRIALESSLYERNCMITLTYNEDNLPEASRLVKRDLQLFMKRLRKHYEPLKIRFFGCGEYGSKNGRPHYHVILFNVDFEDKFFFCYDNKNTELFRSPTLEKLWPLGFSSVGKVNFDSAKYCAIYMQKPPKDGRPKAFTIMSRRPGIGFEAIRKQWLATDKIYYNGKYIKIPRYFLDVLERRFPNEVALLKDKRLATALKFDSKQVEIQFQDKLKRIKKLQKVFKSDLADYFDLLIDFGEISEITEKNKKVISKMSKNYDILTKNFQNSIDISKLPSIIDYEVCVKADNFCE